MRRRQAILTAFIIRQSATMRRQVFAREVDEFLSAREDWKHRQLAGADAYDTIASWTKFDLTGIVPSAKDNTAFDVPHDRGIPIFFR